MFANECAVLLVITVLIIPHGSRSTNSTLSSTEGDIVNKTVDSETIATCPEDMFQCRSGHCIFRNRTCNNLSDCSDNTDEDNSVCEGRDTCYAPDIKNGIVTSSLGSSSSIHGQKNIHFYYQFRCSGNYSLFPKNQQVHCRDNYWSGIIPQCLHVSISYLGNRSISSSYQKFWTSRAGDIINKTLVSDSFATCLEDMFNCRNGQCFFQHRTCNGLLDCIDNPDENNTVCKGRDACYVPDSKNGIIRPSVTSYDDIDQTTKFHISLHFSCFENYRLFPETEEVDCYDNKWFGEIPQCLLTCPSRIARFIQTSCEKDGSKLDCALPLVEGATVSMKCKPHYDERNPLNRPAIECDTVCGQVTPQGKLLIINGTSTKFGEFPWHVGIYKKTTENIKNEYQCGGSIINPKVVLTAAHCFTAEDGILLDITEFSVAAGKYFRDYESRLDLFAQKRQVETVYIPGYYKGFISSYSADIALVILTETFELTNAIRPICVDWNNVFENDQLKSTSFGKVAGWGYTQEGILLAKSLKQLRVPYIDRDTCVQVVPEHFIRFVTPDKFCAGYKNGSSVCNGDSGGGLVFYREEDKKYYIRGLVSIGPVNSGVCDSHQYGAFTKISHYLEYIKPIVEKHSGKCRRLYVDANNKTTVAKCSSGRWDIPLITCVPECGETTPQNTLLTISGLPVKKNNFPWHTGIYRRDTVRDVYTYLCGGSIISARVVIIHIFCLIENFKLDISNLFVAAGKFYKDYESPLDIIAQQRKIIQVEYNKENRDLYLSGKDIRMEWTIGLVIVEYPFEVNNFVRPVCIDWDNSLDDTATTTGTLTDWKMKFSKGEEATEELKQLTFPFHSVDTCKKYYASDILICTAEVVLNESAICYISNGAGLVSYNKENRKYYLRGIMNKEHSFQMECNVRGYTLYLPVIKYLDYIKEIELKYRV